MGAANVVHVTDEDFKSQVLDSDVPVLVDFWAEWCMPCKMIAPILEELAAEYGDKLKIGKVDTDSNRQVAMQYGISAIPTLILFHNGEMAKKFVGLQQKADLKAALDEHVG